MPRKADGETRDQVREMIEGDPEGNLTDDAIGAALGISQQAVSYARGIERLPSARARRKAYEAAEEAAYEAAAEVTRRLNEAAQT